MSRRGLLFLLVLGVLATPLVSRAQVPTTVRRIGWLSPGAQLPAAELEQQVAPLRELGWIEGRNLSIERRFTNGAKPEVLRMAADELVRLKVEVIVSEGTEATRAAKTATSTIPIVMRSAGDPVQSGLVESLARPGGNITGYSVRGPEIAAKGISLMLDLLPTLKRIGVLTNPTSAYFHTQRSEFERVCRSLGIQPTFIEVTKASELTTAVAQAARQGAQALVLEGDRLFIDNRVDIMSAALRHALPTLGDGTDHLEAGALLSFGFSALELRRRGAAYIDKILRGANPADLPVEQPTQFEVGINLKTAKALGIAIPRSLLSLADVVIE